MTARPGTNAVLLAFAGVYLIWGTTFLGIALAIRTIPPFFSGAFRFFVAAGLMYAWLRARTPRPFAGLNIAGSLLCGVLLSGVGNGFVIWAQQGLPSGITALFICALPVMILLFDWLFFSHQTPTPRGVLGVALGLAGVVVLTLHTHALSGQMRPIHVVAVLIAELGWALGSLLQRRYVDPNRLGSYTCLQMFAGAAFQLLMGVLDREWIASPRRRSHCSRCSRCLTSSSSAASSRSIATPSCWHTSRHRRSAPTPWSIRSSRWRSAPSCCTRRSPRWRSSVRCS